MITSDGSVGFVHDDNGNITQKTDGATEWTYDYDVHDRLVHVEKDGVPVADYGYDPFGRRLWKTLHEGGTSSTTYYAYTGEGLAAEFDAATRTLQKSYGYRPGGLWGTNPLYLWSDEVEAAGKYYWYANDRLGTPQLLADESGQVLWLANTAVYGQAMEDAGNLLENPLRLPGQYLDAETGLHYNWNRYYDPATGRYMTLDPIRDGLNWYAYAGGNPARWVDPEGKEICTIALLTAGAIGMSGAIGLGGTEFAQWLTNVFTGGDAPNDDIDAAENNMVSTVLGTAAVSTVITGGAGISSAGYAATYNALMSDKGQFVINNVYDFIDGVSSPGPSSISY